MRYKEGAEREQIILLPESIDEYVSEDNPVRVIDAFVDSLDLARLKFTKSVPADTGCPAYDPSDLLKLYVYGYSSGTLYITSGQLGADDKAICLQQQP